MALTLEQAIARVPFLAEARSLCQHAADRRRHQPELQDRRGWQVVCVAHLRADTDKLGIRGMLSTAPTWQPASLGIAPEVLYCIEPEGYLVTRFIKARRFRPRSLHDLSISCAWRENCVVPPQGARARRRIQRLPARRDADRRLETEELPLPIGLRLADAADRVSGRGPVAGPVYPDAVPRRPIEPELAR